LKRENWKELIFDCPMSYLFAGSIQLLITILLGLFDINVMAQPIIVGCFLVAIMVLAIVAHYNKKIQLVIEKIYGADRAFMFLVMFNIFILFTIVNNTFWMKTEVFYEYLHILLIIVFIYVMFNMIFVGSIIRMDRQKRKLKMLSAYTDVMTKSNLELKRKEHDFAKHLEAIIPVINSATSLDVAQKEVAAYIGSIRDEYKKQVKNVIIADNSFIAAYFSYVLVEIEKKDIEFKYTMAKSISKYEFTQDQFIIIMSNLIDNAIDAVMELSSDNRKITVLFDHGLFVVKNTVAPDFDESIISKFKEVGYSTKDFSRGVGLANVDLVLKKKGMDFVQYYKDGWFISEIYFDKELKMEAPPSESSI
jgi:sensor histidine kinase regulating citrate/malate metabolism